jgi:hypothetical protein
MDLQQITITVSIIGLLITIITQWEKILKADWQSLGGIFVGIIFIFVGFTIGTTTFDRIYIIGVGIFCIVCGVVIGIINSNEQRNK